MDRTKLLSENLIWAPAKAVSAVDRLMYLYRTSDMWTVLDEILRFWESTNPKEYKSFIVDLGHTKGTRKVTKGWTGVSIDKDGRTLRYRLDIPLKVVYMFRKLYPVEDVPMDKEFYDKFARRYPKMIISERA